jgi:hypothetical protein
MNWLPDQAVEVFRGQVSTIGPNNCVSLGIELNLAEKRLVSKWLEYRPVEAFGQIDLSLRGVVESQPNSIFAEVPGGRYVQHYSLQWVDSRQRLIANSSIPIIA